jgi:hypothetical protein
LKRGAIKINQKAGCSSSRQDKVNEGRKFIERSTKNALERSFECIECFALDFDWRELHQKALHSFCVFSIECKVLNAKHELIYSLCFINASLCIEALICH